MEKVRAELTIFFVEKARALHLTSFLLSVLLSRGHTSDFLLAQVMRFFQILSRRQRERVATRATNASASLATN